MKKVLLIIPLVFIFSFVSATADTFSIKIVSVSESGVQGNGASDGGSLNPDGTLVHFTSRANNLVSGDTNGGRDVFIKNILTGEIEMISKAQDGGPSDGESTAGAFNSTGEYIFFQSLASNLVTDDTNGLMDVFIYDVNNKIVELISKAPDGTSGNGKSDEGQVSADGRYVVFGSFASNLVTNDTNGAGKDGFLRDRLIGSTTLISLNGNGEQLNNTSGNHRISGNGRYIIYDTKATNAVPNDNNNRDDVFRFDRQTGEVILVSNDVNGSQANGTSRAQSLSSDGNIVFFHSLASNLVPEDTNGVADLFKKNIITGEVELISVNELGEQANGLSNVANFDENLNYVTFFSDASNLVPNDTNGRRDVFVKNLNSGEVALVSVAENGVQGNASSEIPSISQDGNVISFFSAASNLVLGDTNGAWDVFATKNPLLTSGPENTYPLYTQIESPNPSVVETADWEDDLYAGGVDGWCGNTIGGCGCVITSLVMAGRNVGIETDVLDADVNPKNINEYLESVGGYTSGGAVSWLAASAYLGEINGSGKLASRFASAPTRPATEVGAMSFIDAALAEGDNAVLAYKEGHFVWLPEKTETSYVVRDPWWYETLTADDVDNDDTYIRDYDNTFTDARVIKIHDEPVEFSGTDIEAHLISETAELLFENAAGQVGYVDGGILIDLDRASYGNTEVIALDGVPVGADAGKHLLVYEAGEEFTIDVVGTDVGQFTLEFLTIDEIGEVTTFEFSGLTLPGLTTTFTFNLETGEVTEQAITYEQFLNLLGQELEGYSSQQRKFFLKWTEKIFENMEEKTTSQALQSIEVFKKLLIAKKVDSLVLTTALDLIESGL